MTSNRPRRDNRSPPPDPAPSAAERGWRRGFFFLSAALAAAALVDFDAGRVARGVGNAGACCLVLSLLPKFPLLRLLREAAGGRSGADPVHVLREAERLRAAHPWTAWLGQVGWSLLAASLILRLLGGN